MDYEFDCNYEPGERQAFETCRFTFLVSGADGKCAVVRVGWVTSTWYGRACGRRGGDAKGDGWMDV
jgi:hypothetical protein